MLDARRRFRRRRLSITLISIDFNVLESIIKSYVNHPILLNLIIKACRRTETRGGLFYDYDAKSLPKGSPLSPILGAIALIPLDKAMGQVKGIFYARFVDDWVVLTKSKTALRKIVKITHQVVNDLKLQLHPCKTYIGKIAHGFNFLAYFMDHQKILPSKETIRRFQERATALYESPQTNRNVSRRSQKTAVYRDISEYHVSELPPTDLYFQNIMHICCRLLCERLIPLRPCGGTSTNGRTGLSVGYRQLKNLNHTFKLFYPASFHVGRPPPLLSATPVNNPHLSSKNEHEIFLPITPEQARHSINRRRPVPPPQTPQRPHHLSYKLFLDKLSIFSVIR